MSSSSHPESESTTPVLQRRVALPNSGKDVIILTLNRPKKYNSFHTTLCHLLARVVHELVDAMEEDPTSSPAAVVLKGQGQHFCAGADLSNPPSPLEQSSDLAHNLQNNPVYQMSRLQVPLIGALQGYCITGGFELALACDILVGDESVIFRDTHVKFGLAPCWGLSQKLQRRIGVGRAKLVSMSAMSVRAKLAHEWGLLDELVIGASTSLQRAVEIADMIGKNDDTMVQRYKRAIDEGGSMDLSKGLQRERALGLAHYLEALQDGNTFEGAREFITDEKRHRSKL